MNLTQWHLATQLLDSTLAPPAVIDLLWVCGPPNELGPEVSGPSALAALEVLERQVALRSELEDFYAQHKITEEHQRLQVEAGYLCGSRLDDLGEIVAVIDQLNGSMVGAEGLARGLAVNPWLSAVHFAPLAAKFPAVGAELEARRQAAHALAPATPETVAAAGAAHCAEALAELWLGHATGNAELDENTLSALFSAIDGATTEPLMLRAAMVGFVAERGNTDAVDGIRCDIAERCRVIDRDLLAWTRTDCDDFHVALARAVLDGRSDATFSEAAGLWALAHTAPEVAQRSYDAAGALYRWKMARDRLDEKIAAGRKERWQRNADRIEMAEVLGQSFDQAVVLALNDVDGLDPVELCRLVAECAPDIFVQVVRGHMRFRPGPGEIAKIFSAMDADTQGGVVGLLGFMLMQGLELAQLPWAGDVAVTLPQASIALGGRLVGFGLAQAVHQSLGDDVEAWEHLLERYTHDHQLPFHELVEQVGTASAA